MKKITIFAAYLYFSILILFSLSPFWPKQFWWLATLFQIAPLWVLYIPLGILFVFSIGCKKKQILRLCVLFFLVISVGIMGFELNNVLDNGRAQKPKSKSLRVMTANLGGGSDTSKLFRFIKETNPDVLFLQETSDALEIEINREKAFQGWHKSFNRGLSKFGLISKYKIRRVDSKRKKTPGENDAVIIKYDLELFDGLIPMFNLHLYTIGEGLEALIGRQGNAFGVMKHTAMMQEVGSSFFSDSTSSSKNILVAGDFNMRDLNPVYRKDWSKFSNAFSKAGFGFGYTKYTSWHGARIDHVLYDGGWKATSAFVGPDLGGDHRPLVVDLEFIGEIDDEHKIKNNGRNMRLEDKDYFVLESFEQTPGRFSRSNKGKLTIDSGNTYLRGRSLKVQNFSKAEKINASIQFKLWRMLNYPVVSFSYRIPKESLVSLRVKTYFDDWICLGGTKTAHCSDKQVNSPVILIDDDEWHEIDIVVGDLVKELLPAMKYLKEFQFNLHENWSLDNKFWIDDFRIGEK